MRTIINGFAAAAMLIAVPALAETKPGTSTAGESVEQAQQTVKDKRYCAETVTTGSRLTRKVCKTRAQWIDEDGFDPLAQK